MTTGLQKSSQETLRRLIDQIERLEEQKKDISGDIQDKFVEAKSQGFDIKIMRKVLRLRKQPKTDREEEQAILDVYLHSLGMLSDTPLGQFAINQATHGAH